MTALAAIPRPEATATTISDFSRSEMVFQQLLARAGWTIDFADIDLTHSAPIVVLKCHRHDGLWLWAKVDSLGRASLETFQRESWLGKPANTKGNWPLSPQHEDHFLGRQRFENGQSLLNGVFNYLVDNAREPIALADLQSAWLALPHAGALRLSQG